MWSANWHVGLLIGGARRQTTETHVCKHSSGEWGCEQQKSKLAEEVVEGHYKMQKMFSARQDALTVNLFLVSMFVGLGRLFQRHSRPRV